MNDEKNTPVDTIRDGALKISIWENGTERGSVFNAQIARTYEDQDGALRDTGSLRADDLLALTQAVPKAYERMRELQREEFRSRQTDRDVEADRDAFRNERSRSIRKRDDRDR